MTLAGSTRQDPAHGSEVASEPAGEYRRRLDARRTEHARLERVDAAYGWARLALFALAAVLALLTYRGIVSGWTLAGPILGFAVLVVRHDRVIRAREAAARAVTFYEHGLARLEDRWAGLGHSGDRFRSDAHPYAADLDLFGRGSLFQLLSIARTQFGEDALASWLLAPSAVPEIHARQDAVRELTPALDLREATALAGSKVGAGVDGAALVTWAEAPPTLRPPVLRWLAALLTAAMVVAIAIWAASGSATLVLVILLMQLLAFASTGRAVQRALHAATGPARDLDILVELLARLDRETFSSSRLVALQSELRTRGRTAASVVAALHRLVEMHDWQHNPLFAPVAALFMWGTHLAWAIEAWRSRHGAHVAVWLRTVGEFEALSSLAGYRYEHPDDPFPEIEVPGAVRTALFDGTGLGHPLIPARQMVTNDVRLDGRTQLLVVSGSNMSGKSTFLRTVGVAGVMALAGAPVRARALRLTPVAIGATLRIQDSLQEGRSRFYAEITRIRDLSVLAAGPVPLLFLLDELFHGTNSHDRLVGATGVLRGLLDRNAVGLVTTHDLALTAIADDLAPRGVNVHFEDWFDGGELRFDYRVKPGPVTRSNALALMRAVGLDVLNGQNPCE